MSRQYSTADIKTFEQATMQLRANGFDDSTEAGLERNGNSLHEYFQANPAVPVTVQAIFKAVESRKQDYKWFSAAEQEYRKIEAENPAESSTKLTAWFSTQGKPGTLVNSGDDGHENFAILLAELRGREVNPTTIQQAIGRIAFNGRRQLHVVPTPRALSPAAQAAQDHRPGEFVSRTDMVRTADGGWRNKNAAEQAADRRLAEAQKNPGQANNIIEQQARQESEGLQGNSHSQTAQIRKLFVTKRHSSDIDWIATLNARKRMQAQFERSAAVSFRRY